MAYVSDELELILRLGPNFDGDFDALVDAAQGDGWEGDDARWTVTRRLDRYGYGSAALRQIEVWESHGSNGLLAGSLLELFASWVERGRPRLKFSGWANEQVRDLTAPELLGLARALGLDDEVLPAELKIRKLASALKVIVAGDLETRLVATVRRWESQGHFEHGRDGSQLHRNLRSATVRNRPKRDRTLEPLERPYVPPSTQDVRRAQ
jgi:hypothetical protein